MSNKKKKFKDLSHKQQNEKLMSLLNKQACSKERGFDRDDTSPRFEITGTLVVEILSSGYPEFYILNNTNIGPICTLTKHTSYIGAWKTGPEWIIDIKEVK